ncbi:putative ACR [anaerobic digester metagenome]
MIKLKVFSMKYVLIVNKSRGTRVGYADVAASFMSRFRGLMFRKELQRGLILKLPKTRSRRGSAIHMFFMRMPLDIVFADSNMKVVDTVSIGPWKTYTPKSAAQYVIELEKGTIDASKTQIGDELDFMCENV